MAILRPPAFENESDQDGEGAHASDAIDLTSFGANKATDYFILKFLMCNQKTSDGLDPVEPVPEPSQKEEEKVEAPEKEKEKEEEEDDEFTISD